MKALIYTNPKKVEVRDIPEPTFRAGSVKLKMKYCGICGSDIGIFLGTHPRAKAPLVLGHEFLGEVVEEGKKFKKGDRVVAYPLLSCGNCLPCRTGNAHVCNTLGLIGIDVDGGIAQYGYVDEDVLFKVPDKVSDIAATVIEPLAVIVRAIHQSNFKSLDVVAVIGAGPIGMITGMMLKHMGASKIFISDVDEKRLEMAKQFGLIPVNAKTESMETISKLDTDGEGVDVLFECSGAEIAAMEMTNITRVGGSICMVSVHKAPHNVNLRDINFKEQHMVGTRVYTKEEFRQAVEYAAQINGDLEKIVSHIVPLKDSENVFDMIADPQYGTVKVLVDCTKI
ncbi:alcohol dehydrogenase catalytic domain-containing protein [Alkalibaculum sp. M08DMB]|uniref:Alcohol dehydrogenase catalytic domain-containing protein n=1 Tax=Alkalibaculum sporogenes TaxID=2655001 RepID=A0A6A7K864_9FIRM|nr:alcohol dehydrogenase catalytic domain-containing protein [Alkalibaculum sporogenes]MPW25407.1 alcohol dehydrogenase catalytic domain-containing protein [Alkalibaculum sporogenes]